MKKTRKVLSIVLAVLFAFSSMPVVYTGTAAVDAVTYAAGGEGTLDNPTRPVAASGAINQTDLYKLNINSQSTEYTFYQTIDNEYFTFGQTQGLQNFYETDVGSRTLTFESISFYEGMSEMDGTTEPKEISSGFGRWETPLITNNPTTEFLSKYYVSNTWKSTNSNAAEVGSKPENFVLHGAWTDIGGCMVYTWQNDIIFKGNSADVTGEINTGYYEQLFWNWVNSDATQSARFDLRIGTTLRVLDARELAKEMAEAEYIIDNPDDYTTEYVSSVEATLNTIPDDLRDFSKVYDQSTIDSYTQMLKDVSLNSADYTEFNETYKELKSITNAKGAYTSESFEVFKVEIANINKDLPKNLDKTKQSTVDAATQALKNAYDKLVATDVSDSEDSYYFSGTDNSGNVNITVKNVNLKFMQTKDSQQFTFTQNWTLERTGGSNKRIIYRITLDESLPLYCGDTSCQSIPALTENKTSDFISRMSTGITTITGDDADGTSFTAKEFTTWASDDGLVSDGRISSEYGLEEKTYNATVSPTFVGNSASQKGEISTNFVQRIGYKYYTGVFQYKYRHFHINSTVTVTDVRQLISAVAEAKETLANPGTHSENYITALHAAVDSVPVEMLRGIEYYTQEEVDKLYNDITTISEDVADYSEFVEVFDKMKFEDNSKYTEASYNTFMGEIYAINQGLSKNLTADQQATVDAAVDALYAAHDKLVSIHLNDDNVFTQEDISDLSDVNSNNPLAFSVSSTQYNFMQIADGQQFAVRTELTARNTKSRYTCNLLSLKFSSVAADTVATICEARETPDTGCHNGENVLVNQSQLVLDYVTGVTKYTANDAGDIGEHTTWVNTSGVALSSGGVLNDPTTLSTTDSSAYAEYYYTGASGNQETPAPVNVQYAFRLGWSYNETVLGVEGETIRRHVHIPVTVNITDARALNSLYEEAGDIITGKTDKTYTFNSLVNLYNAYNATDADMAYGNEYYTQDQVNAEYAELKAAYDALQEGADYSEYFKAYVQAEEIINSNNTDSRGNSLYEKDAYSSFVETVTNIDNGLSKDLENTTENQATIDTATQGILSALSELKNYELADYSKLNDAMTEAEKILAEEEANPGTYTQETIDAIQNAYDNALENAFNNDPDAVHKELHVDQQATVDAAASALEAAIADKEYKADYSEYDEAYNKVQDIINNPDKYTEETVKAAEDAMNTAGAIDKDLADTAENRQTIADATDALNNVVNNAVERADYSKFDEAYKAVEEIANDTTGKYTDATIQAAKDALVEADKLDTNLPKSDESQASVDAATSALQTVIDGAQLKADYTDYNNAKTEADAIINAGNVDENGNAIYNESAFNAYQQAVNNTDTNLNKDLSTDYQTTVDEATQALEEAKANLENNKNADYTDFNAAKDALEEIVANPDKYTSATVEAAQSALDSANQIPDGLPVGENNIYQNMIDSATNSMNQVLDAAQKKADYTDFNAAKDALEEIVNNPDKYTEETVQAAKDALAGVESVSDDLPESAQPQLDEATAKLQEVLDAAQKKADYTDYNAAKDYADNIVNDDGNGNPVYDEEAFEAYKEAVNNIDSALNKNLPESEQATVDEATQALKDLRTELEASKGAEQEIIDPETAVDDIVNKVIEDITNNQGYTEDEIIIEFKNYLGEELAGEGFIGTGSTMRVILKSTGELLDYKLYIVMGDVDGNGQITADDYNTAMDVALEMHTYSEENYYFLIANDMDEDTVIDVLDVTLIRRMY